MKKLIILPIALLAIIILSGCENGSRERHGQHTADSVELLGEVRYYDVASFRLDIDIDFLQFYLFIHQDELHLFLREVDESSLNTYIHLLTMDAEGANLREIYRTLLDESIDFFNIIGFEKHDDGYITLVTTDNVIFSPYTRDEFFNSFEHFDVGYTYVYRRISPDGEIVFVSEISALNNDERQISISEIAFDLDGNAVASVFWLPADFELSLVGGAIPEDVGGRSFFLFDNGLMGNFREVKDETYSSGFFNRMNDGQVIVSNFAFSGAADLIMFY